MNVFMNFSLELVKRLQQVPENPSRKARKGSSGLIIRLATAAVAISIMVMILAIAIVKGYQQQVRNKLIGFNAPIQVTHLDLNNSYESLPIEKDSLYETQVKKLKGITGIHSYCAKAGIIKTNEAFEGILLKGVTGTYNWEFIKEHLKEGRLLNPDEPTEIVISSITAKRMKRKLNEKLLVYFIDEPPRIRKFTIVGIFDTGLSDLDELYAFCNEPVLRKLNNWPAHFISGYEITIANPEKVEETSAEVELITPIDKGVNSVFKRYPQLFDWLELLDMNVLIILLLMLAVAGINMITALLILILERSQMIGLLKALGARDRQVGRIFLFMALRIVLTGMFWGNLIGIGLAIIQQQTGIIRLDESAYYLETVPIRLDWIGLFWLNVGSFLSCLLILLLPARFVSRISPVKTLRFN